MELQSHCTYLSASVLLIHFAEKLSQSLESPNLLSKISWQCREQNIESCIFAVSNCLGKRPTVSACNSEEKVNPFIDLG
jgi:hypothetical protein